MLWLEELRRLGVHVDREQGPLSWHVCLFCEKPAAMCVAYDSDCWLFCSQCGWSGDIVNAAADTWKVDRTEAASRLRRPPPDRDTELIRQRRERAVRVLKASQPLSEATGPLLAKMRESRLDPRSPSWRDRLLGCASLHSGRGLRRLLARQYPDICYSRHDQYLLVPFWDLPGRLSGLKILRGDGLELQMQISQSGPGVAGPVPDCLVSEHCLLLYSYPILDWLRLLDDSLRSASHPEPLLPLQLPLDGYRSQQLEWLPPLRAVRSEKPDERLWEFLWRSRLPLHLPERSEGSFDASQLSRVARQQARSLSDWSATILNTRHAPSLLAAACDHPGLAGSLPRTSRTELHHREHGQGILHASVDEQELLEREGRWYIDGRLLSDHAVRLHTIVVVENKNQSQRPVCYHGVVHHPDGAVPFTISPRKAGRTDWMREALLQHGRSCGLQPPVMGRLSCWRLAALLRPPRVLFEPPTVGWHRRYGAFYLSHCILRPGRPASPRILSLPSSAPGYLCRSPGISAETLRYLSRRNRHVPTIWAVIAGLASSVLHQALGWPRHGLLLTGRAREDLREVAKLLGCSPAAMPGWPRLRRSRSWRYKLQPCRAPYEVMVLDEPLGLPVSRVCQIPRICSDVRFWQREASLVEALPSYLDWLISRNKTRLQDEATDDCPVQRLLSDMKIWWRSIGGDTTPIRDARLYVRSVPASPREQQLLSAAHLVLRRLQEKKKLPTPEDGKLTLNLPELLRLQDEAIHLLDVELLLAAVQEADLATTDGDEMRLDLLGLAAAASQVTCPVLAPFKTRAKPEKEKRDGT